MSQTFAQLIERVKQLSLHEKQELLELLNGLLIEGRVQEAEAHVGADFDEEASRPKPNLAELASRMPADQQATEESLGERVGKEEW